jgi:O-antigen ligase
MLAMSLLRSRWAFLLVLAVSVVAGWPRVDELLNAEVTGANAEGNFLRLELWRQSLDVTASQPLLGTGVAGYAIYYMTFFPERALSSHSTYLDVISQTGLVGSIFFVWLLVAMFRIGLLARRRWPSGFAAGFVNGVLAGMVGVLVAMALGDWLIPFVYNQTIAGFRYTVHSWLLFGALAATLGIRAER